MMPISNILVFLISLLSAFAEAGFLQGKDNESSGPRAVHGNGERGREQRAVHFDQVTTNSVPLVKLKDARPAKRAILDAISGRHHVSHLHRHHEKMVSTTKLIAVER